MSLAELSRASSLFSLGLLGLQLPTFDSFDFLSLLLLHMEPLLLGILGIALRLANPLLCFFLEPLLAMLLSLGQPHVPNSFSFHLQSRFLPFVLLREFFGKRKTLVEM